MLTLFGVLGFPVGHSRSPAMMAAAFRELGLRWRYLKLPVPPERFAETVRALPASGYAGANVTVPHKLAAHRLADSLGAVAAAVGAVNTLTFADGRIEGDNTDAAGFLDALPEPPAGRRALVLGAGGSARAVVWALLRSGAEVAVWNRTPARAEELCAELGARVVGAPAEAEMIVNATSVGLDPALDEADAVAALGLDRLPPPALVVDLVYGAGRTPLVRWAERSGALVVDGLEVLVRQGARSVERWTGRSAPLEAMRAAARAA
ncbi:MAG TPA: shikimate dehydrogenase [Thermoleophilaceae bacterium]|nr:shikimate dehydrogenase [Thermoleophilaceae bacterium]